MGQFDKDSDLNSTQFDDYPEHVRSPESEQGESQNGNSDLSVAYEKVDYISSPNTPGKDPITIEAAFYAQSFQKLSFIGPTDPDAGQRSKTVTMHTLDGELTVNLSAAPTDQRGEVQLQAFPLSSVVGHYNDGTDYNSTAHSLEVVSNGCAVLEKFYVSFNDLDPSTQEYVDLSSNNIPAPFGMSFSEAPHPQYGSDFTDSASVFTPNADSQYLLIELDPDNFNGFNSFTYVAGTNLTTPSSGSNATFHATYYRPIKKTIDGWVNYRGQIITESDASFHTRQDLIDAGLLSGSDDHCVEMAPQPRWVIPNPPDREYQLNRSNPVVDMDLSDITATGTDLVIGNEADTGQTALRSGSITRVGNKAYCELEIEIDEDDNIVMTFGSSIVPSGAEILDASFVATNVDIENANFRRPSSNQLRINRVNNINIDNAIRIGFWVGGLPDFIEYNIQDL